MNTQPEFGELAEAQNLAQTLAHELKQPIELESPDELVHRIALPPGWKIEETDHIKLASAPRRKVARVTINDANSFADYILRHKLTSYSTLWCEADYRHGAVAFTAILNDHGGADEYAQWRDHTAHYTPPKSEEWRRWFGQNATPMKQAEFAVFLEDNMRDIATADGLPTAAQMLEMALQFEAKQDMRLKSHIRLQSGGVEMNFVQDDDTGTIEKMRIFERFRLGIPVFWNGAAYAIDARLRYRVRDGAVSFWFELIRPDRVLEDATRTLIDNLLLATEVPLFHGKPQ
ncbi:MAG: DUF2303 family protein [Rhodocyclaceae bacterium]|nr:DUF2303 family protein [Rhodocyclaceae bacterium]